MRVLGSPRGAIEGVYQTQGEAYDSLVACLRARFEDKGPCVRSAALVQTSGTSASQLLMTILDRCFTTNCTWTSWRLSISTYRS